MDKKTLTVAPAVWSDAHAAILARALSRGARIKGAIEDLRMRVESGGATLYAVTDDAGELVGAAVLWIEHCAAGAEGVIAATAGAPGAGVRLLDLLPHFEQRLRDSGCVTIRVHPCRPGMLRFCLRAGYRPREWVLAKAAI